MVKSIVYKVYLRILQVPGISVNSHVAVIFLVFLIGKVDKKRYDSELPYQRPDLIEVMEIEIDLTTSTNVHTGFYISVRECLD